MVMGRATTKALATALKSQLETSVPKTGESGPARRQRMEMKVGKAVLKEDRAIQRGGRDHSWNPRAGDTDAQKFRAAGLAAHDSKDLKIAGKQVESTRTAAIGDSMDVGEREMRGFADAYAEQAASLRLRPMSFENWIKARKGE